MTMRWYVLNLVFLVTVPSSGQAQSCRDARCPIALTPSITLQHEDLTFGRGFPPQVVRDSRGNLWVADGIGSTEVLVFDSLGRFLRKVGRRGAGPGEIQALLAIQIVPGDTLVAVDATQRISIFSSDGRFVRSRNVLLPGLQRILVLWTSGLVANQIAPTQSAVEVYLGDEPRGRVLDSARLSTMGSREFVALLREFAPAGLNTFWIVWPTRYQFERWDVAGRRLQSLGRRPTWFVRDESAIGAPDLVRPQPMVTGVRQDGSQLVVFTAIARVGWTPTGPPPNPGRERPRQTFADAGRLFDTMIDVLDIRTGAVLASARVAGNVQPGPCGNCAMMFAEDADGAPGVRLFRVEVRPADGGGSM